MRFFAGDWLLFAYSVLVKQHVNGRSNQWRVLVGVLVAFASFTAAQGNQRVLEKTGGFSYTLPQG